MKEREEENKRGLIQNKNKEKEGEAGATSHEKQNLMA